MGKLAFVAFTGWGQEGEEWSSQKPPPEEKAKTPLAWANDVWSPSVLLAGMGGWSLYDMYPTPLAGAPVSGASVYASGEFGAARQGAQACWNLWGVAFQGRKASKLRSLTEKGGAESWGLPAAGRGGVGRALLGCVGVHVQVRPVLGLFEEDKPVDSSVVDVPAGWHHATRPLLFKGKASFSKYERRKDEETSSNELSHTACRIRAAAALPQSN